MIKNKNKQLIFIDDSGDPGLKNNPSTHFVMAAAVFMDPAVAMAIEREIVEFRQSKGWSEKAEFKFQKTSKTFIKELLRRVSRYDFEIYVVYIDKAMFGQMVLIVDGEKLYNWALKELLVLIPLDDVSVKIDGRATKSRMLRTATYLRRELKYGKIKIKFEDSASNELIQLADLIAGAVNRSFARQKTDAKDYLRIIKKKIVKMEQIKFR